MGRLQKNPQLSISAKQTLHELIVEMNIDTKNLNELLKLYHAQMYHTTITEGLSEIKTLMENKLTPKNTHEQSEQDRNLKLSTLRQLPITLPTRE